MYQYLTRRNITIAVIGLVVLSIIASVFYVVNQNQYDAKVTVTSAPDVIKMSYGSVKDKTVKSGDILRVKSGAYKFYIWADGFELSSVEMKIEKGDERSLLVALTAKTTEAKQELEKTKYNRVKDGIGSRIVNEGGRRVEENSPVLKHLPYEERDFGIYSCTPYRKKLEETYRVGICITVAGRNSDQLVKRAYAKLAEFGVKPDDYDVKINNNIVPTEKEKQQGAAVPCGGNSPSWCYRFSDR